MDCLLRKDELEQLDALLFLGEKRRTEYLIAAVALFVMFIVWTYLLPKHKNVVKVESPPHGAWTPLSDLRASETIRNIATAESECMASGVVGTLDSAACGTLDGSEPAVEGSEPSDRAVSAEPAETDSLLQARKRAPRTSVPGTSPSRPNTRSRCKD